MIADSSERKRPNIAFEEEPDMSVKEALQKISKRLDMLEKREDDQKMKVAYSMWRLEQAGSRQRCIAALKKTEDVRNRVKQQSRSVTEDERGVINDLQYYSRRF